MNKNEPPRVKTNKMACARSEDSDLPGHPPRLIRVFAVSMKESQVLSYPLSAQPWLWSGRADAQANPSLRWAHCHFVGFVMSRLKCPLNVLKLTDRRLYHDTIHWQWKPDMMGLTHTKAFAKFILRSIYESDAKQTNSLFPYWGYHTGRNKNIYIIEPCHEKTCFMLYANNEGADQLARPRSLIYAFVVCCLDSIILILSITKISRL